MAPATEMCGREARLWDRPAGGIQLADELAVAAAGGHRRGGAVELESAGHGMQ